MTPTGTVRRLLGNNLAQKDLWLIEPCHAWLVLHYPISEETEVSETKTDKRRKKHNVSVNGTSVVRHHVDLFLLMMNAPLLENRQGMWAG